MCAAQIAKTSLSCIPLAESRGATVSTSETCFFLLQERQGADNTTSCRTPTAEKGRSSQHQRPPWTPIFYDHTSLIFSPTLRTVVAYPAHATAAGPACP